MSISSEESPKSGGSKEAKDNDHHQQDVDPEHDVIVPTIQRRRPKYVWPNRNNDSLRLRSNGRDDLFQHLESGIRVRLCKNDNRAADPFQNVRTGCYDDIALNWSYPAVPLPIAVVTSGKSSLQDMSANINDRYKSPLNSDGNLSDHRNVSLDFHKALFQRSYPVPSTEKITRTFHV